MERGRRDFLKTALGLACAVSGCATAGESSRGLIDLTPRLIPGVSGRQTPALPPFSASFAEHLRRISGDSSGIGSAGIDYAPHPGPSGR